MRSGWNFYVSKKNGLSDTAGCPWWIRHGYLISGDPSDGPATDRVTHFFNSESSMAVTCIDLFAGAGGFSTGAKLAGLKVIWAANHWKEAVAIHARNHPHVRHECQDLCQANFSLVPDHTITLASPACQGHSKARGKERAHHDNTRSTAWAVIACADVKRPKAIIVENVPEFLDWTAYPAWKFALECFGYKITTQVLNSADAGVPQNRERVFIVASQGKAIHVPAPNLQHVPCSSFIDMSLNCNNWSKIDQPGRAESTLRRAKVARKMYGDRFLLAYYGNETGGRSLDKPIGTITTKDRFAVINGDYMRMLNVEEYRIAMGFPESYILPETKVMATKMLGNAVPPPLACHVVKSVASQLQILRIAA